MARKSSVKKLPDTVVRALNFQLEKERLTLDDLVEWLRDEHGYDISRSALGRYSQNFAAMREKLQRCREITEAFAKELGPDAVEGDQGRVLIQLFNAITFRVVEAELEGDDPAFDTKDLMMLGRAIKDTAQAGRFHQDFEDKLRARIAEEERRKAADSGAKALSLKGLSKKEIEFWRRDFLGVARPENNEADDG